MAGPLALMNGLPWLDIVPRPEICGDAAIFVDPSDSAGWTAALEQVAADPALRAGLVTKGHARAAIYTWAKAADAVMEIAQ